MNYYDENELKESKKYGTYLEIKTNKDIFRNIKTQKELQKAAYEYLKNGNKNFTIVDILNNGDTIRFIRESGKEYLYGSNSKTLTNQEYKQKMRISPSIDDLLKKASINYSSPSIHNSRLFFNGFDNYQGILKIDNSYFRYIIRIGINKDSNSIFYDVSLYNFNIKKETDTIVPESDRPSLTNNKSVPSCSNISNENSNVKSYLGVDNNEEHLEIRETCEIYYCFSMC